MYEWFAKFDSGIFGENLRRSRDLRSWRQLRQSNSVLSSVNLCNLQCESWILWISDTSLAEYGTNQLGWTLIPTHCPKHNQSNNSVYNTSTRKYNTETLILLSNFGDIWKNLPTLGHKLAELLQTLIISGKSWPTFVKTWANRLWSVVSEVGRKHLDEKEVYQ